MKNICFLLIMAWCISVPGKLWAQDITISGDGLDTYTVNRTLFQEMKQSVVMAKAHDEKVHRYTGIRLADLLTKAGVMLGDSAKRATIMRYVVVTATDNYKVIFAMPEIDPLFANRTIILANREDRKPLITENGPYQMIVPGEKKHARWIRQVTKIEVVSLKP
jgi:DMSO/TMAO reductase YedYZ molybdopterin-dependent catalytic subunit